MVIGSLRISKVGSTRQGKVNHPIMWGLKNNNISTY